MAAMTMKTKPTKKSAPKRATTAARPTRAACDPMETGEVEFLVYYRHDESDQWECDDAFPTLEAAEAYCREKAETYSDDVLSGEDAPTPWSFYIFEVKGVRSFRYSYNVEITVKEEIL
jgi:hypothetical protein